MRVSLLLLIVMFLSNVPASAQELQGAGATFPAPIYWKWFDQYREQVDARPVLTYADIGSGSGIQQFLDGQRDFAGTDVPLSQAEAAKHGVLQVPTVIGAVVPVYHVAGVTRPLRFTPQVLAEIFSGRIPWWNHPSIVKDNPGVLLPAKPIKIVCRSDGSGTNMVWSRFLAMADPGWKLGVGLTVPWPGAKLAERNEGVAQAVKETENSIGYVEYIYAMQHGLDYGEVRNRAGRFIHADVLNIRAAVPETIQMDEPAKLAQALLNPENPGAYPVASFTWILIPARISDKERRRILLSFLEWALGDGQGIVEGQGYVALPANLVAEELELLHSLH